MALALALLMTSCGSIRDNADRSLEGRPQTSDILASHTALGTAILRSTAVASINQPYTTIRTGLAVLWNRPRELVTGNTPIPLKLSHKNPQHAPGTPGFEAELDAIGCPPVEWGKIRWLVDGDQFFPELDRMLANSRAQIDVQIFIFDNDDIATRYADRLRMLSATRKVRVLFDDLGTTAAQGAAPETPAPAGFTPPDDMKRYLTDGSNVRVRRILNPWFVCDHTKLFVIDRSSALLGGMNIGREYFSEWHDLMLRVDGPVVATLARDFNRAWRKAGPLGDLALIRRPARTITPPPRINGDVPLRVLRTDPAAGVHDIHEATVLSIRAARKRIWIQNPYVAHDGIVRELAQAAKRGVDVRVIIPGKGDSAIMGGGNAVTAAFLIKAGVRVYRYPGMTHMKVMIADGWAQAGSANIDALSLRINRELNIAVSDPATVRALEKSVFQPDFRRSTLIRESEVPPLTGHLAEIIADQL